MNIFRRKHFDGMKISMSGGFYTEEISMVASNLWTLNTRNTNLLRKISEFEKHKQFKLALWADFYNNKKNEFQLSSFLKVFK